MKLYLSENLQEKVKNFPMRKGNWNLVNLILDEKTLLNHYILVNKEFVNLPEKYDNSIITDITIIDDQI